MDRKQPYLIFFLVITCILPTLCVAGSAVHSRQVMLAKLVYKWHSNRLALIDHCRLNLNVPADRLQRARRNYLRLNQKEINRARALLGSTVAGLIREKVNQRYRKMRKSEFNAIFEKKACQQRVAREISKREPNHFKLRWEDGLKKVSGHYLRTCLFSKFNKMYSDRYHKTIESDFHAFWRPPKNVGRNRCTVGIQQDQRGRVLNVRYLQCGHPELRKSAATLLRSRRLPKAPCKEVFSPYVKFTFY